MKVHERTGLHHLFEPEEGVDLVLIVLALQLLNEGFCVRSKA